jgi:Uncharacterized protein conserved in bacteria
VEVPLLLAAVSATSPCGEDLEYDADFLHLERDSLGKPERSMGDSILPAEPPEWRSIQQQSLALLQRSKDLRITHFLLQSSLALEGVSGLARVLTLISELLKQYWADLHPRLDAEDNNDPTVRINALAGLTSDVTVRLLRESILARSRAFGPVSLRAAANASGCKASLTKTSVPSNSPGRSSTAIPNSLKSPAPPCTRPAVLPRPSNSTSANKLVPPKALTLAR